MYIVSECWEFKQSRKMRFHVNYLGQMLYTDIRLSVLYFLLLFRPRSCTPPPSTLGNNKILIYIILISPPYQLTALSLIITN